MSTLTEVVQVIKETNELEARRKAAADQVMIANENKKFDELTKTLKKTSDENKRAQIEANIALIEETRSARKESADNRSDAKKNLDDNKQGLEVLRKEIEENGGKAEANLNFQKAANKIRREELALQKQSATNPSERKEIAKEQRKAQIDALKLAFKGLPLVGRINNLISTIKGVAGMQTGIPGLTIGRLALLTAIPFIIQFLNSPTWKEIKQKLLEIDFSSLSTTIQGFKDAFIGEGVGGKLTVIAAITAATAILAPGLLFKTLEVGLKAFVGAISFVGSRLGLRARGLRGLARAGGILSPLSMVDPLGISDKDRKKQETENKKLKKETKSQTKNVLKNTVKSRGGVSIFTGLKGALRFAGPVGLAFGAIIASVDGVTQGINEYKESGDIGRAVQKGFAGFLSALTLGLVKTDTIDAIITDIATSFQKTFRPTTNEKIETLKKSIAYQQEQIRQGSERTTVAEQFSFGDGLIKLGSGKSREKDMIPRLRSRLAIEEAKMLYGGSVGFMESGGLLSPGRFALVGEQGPELVMANSPMQVFSEQRTDQLGMVALNRMMSGGGGMGGSGTMFLNTGSNVQNVNKSTIVTPIVDQDPVIRQVGRSIMA